MFKKSIAFISIACMLLTGCGAADTPEATTASTTTAATTIQTTTDATTTTEEPEVTTSATTAETPAEPVDTTTATTAATTSEPVETTTAATTTATTVETTAATTTTKPVTTAATTTTAAATTTTATTAAATTTVATTAAPEEPVEVPANGMRNITTMQIVEEMGIGINLGNTYEACGDWIAQWGDGTPESYETAWGSPVITEKMIRGYKEAGFDSLRIPVAWSNLMGENYTISSEYMAAVREVVDWALESDLYVIVNLHYDNGWLEHFPTNKKECMRRYVRIWEQVCEEFKDYGDHLIFESQNEELGWSSVWNQWAGTKGKDESYALVNEINQKFVDVVRASGGNNAERHLLIAGYNTGIETSCDPLYKMPVDPAGRCAVSVHYYTPPNFAILTEDADWGKAHSTWGSSADFIELERNMDMMKENFVDKGIPVIIGEYGCPTENKEMDSVRLFVTSVCEYAVERDMCPVLWSTPGHFYDRDSCKMIDKKLHEMLLEAAK